MNRPEICSGSRINSIGAEIVSEHELLCACYRSVPVIKYDSDVVSARACVCCGFAGEHVNAALLVAV